ncbi:MAG: DNA-directed RNA polymerase subunit beta [Nocardia sp.]|nr:DNA-directed RNA polymerase subunit beta [Nocardia sp.]
MTDSTGGDVAPPTRDTPRSRAEFYREVCGLDARVHPGNHRIHIVAGPVAAITVPVELGQRIKPRLREKFGCDGPIIDHPGSRRWTFLANPDGFGLYDPVLHAELFLHGVSVAPAGSEVVLPAPSDAFLRYRMWNTLPRSPFRPWAGTVVGFALDCVNGT